MYIAVYGGLINLHTNEELDFDEESMPKALAKLKSLPGTQYGVDWHYAGDLDASDDDANIYVSGHNVAFGGETAVSDFLARFDT